MSRLRLWKSCKKTPKRFGMPFRVSYLHAWCVKDSWAYIKKKALLMHQMSIASFMAVIYSTNLGVEVEEGGVQRRFQPTPAAALQAVNDAEAAMDYCRSEILPELVRKKKLART